MDSALHKKFHKLKVARAPSVTLRVTPSSRRKAFGVAVFVGATADLPCGYGYNGRSKPLPYERFFIDATIRELSACFGGGFSLGKAKRLPPGGSWRRRRLRENALHKKFHKLKVTLHDMHRGQRMFFILCPLLVGSHCLTTYSSMITTQRNTPSAAEKRQEPLCFSAEAITL